MLELAFRPRNGLASIFLPSKDSLEKGEKRPAVGAAGRQCVTVTPSSSIFVELPQGNISRSGFGGVWEHAPVLLSNRQVVGDQVLEHCYHDPESVKIRCPDR